MKRTAIAVFLLTLVTPAFAADHLEPETSSFDTRESLRGILEDNDAVLRKFAEFERPQFVARMIHVSPSHTASGVGLAETVGNWQIVALESSGRKLTRCEQSIDSALGAWLANLWQGMLMRTRYPEDRAVHWDADGRSQGGGHIVRTDGEVFHFASLGLSGKSRMPSADSAPRILVDVADSMIAYCRSKSMKDLLTLEQNAHALNQRLDESK